MTLIALGILAVWIVTCVLVGRFWAGVVLASWALSALQLVSFLGDAGSVVWHVRSVNLLGAASEGVQSLFYTVQASPSVNVSSEAYVVIGLALVIAAAFYSRRPLTA